MRLSAGALTPSENTLITGHLRDAYAIVGEETAPPAALRRATSSSIALLHDRARYFAVGGVASALGVVAEMRHHAGDT